MRGAPGCEHEPLPDWPLEAGKGRGCSPNSEAKWFLVTWGRGGGEERYDWPQQVTRARLLSSGGGL